MPLPVKFADVSISLKQFQDISSGRHNAGEVRLKDAHTIDKVNHYVSRTGRNKVSLSHAEVIAVKQAFVDALARGGVQADEIAKIRAQLGLAPEKAVDTQLMERSLRPLSRQQIREILDRNAEALNAGQNEVTIRTSAQIYARVGADTRRRRIAERDAANAGLAESRTVETQRGFSLFQSLLAGDVDFRSKADRAELLQMAKEALGIVLDLSNGHPRADRAAKISWGSNGQRRFTMEAGTDEATFARRLEDMIVRLSGLGPGADAIELRAAFRAVPRGERSRWIDALVRDGGDKTPYKVRTLCVALLQDAGVDDYASLSFPNRLPDAAATSLLRELAALPEGASAERARQCLDMARDLADDGRRANLAYVPATSAEAFNDEVVSAFVNTNERLFGQYRTLAADVLADVRAVFGAAVVPADTTIRLFVTPEAVEGLARAQGGNRLAPEAMRDALRASAAEAAANRALAARVEARLAELNLPPQTPAATAVNALKSRNPDLVGRLAACRTPQDVAAVLDSVLDRMDAELRRASSVQTCKAQFGAMVRAELSARTGIPASALGGDVLSRARISELASGVAHSLGRGDLPSDTPEQIEQAFRDVAKRFADERAAILAKCDRLALSDAAKGELREWLLAQDKVGYLDLDALLDEAAKIDFAPLAAALREGRPKADVYRAMKPFSDGIRPTVLRLLEGKADAIGAPELSNVSGILLIAALDRHPGVRNDLAAFFARPEVRADEDVRYMDDDESYPSHLFAPFGKPPADEARAELSRKIGDGAPPPAFAQALVRAVKAEHVRFPSPDPEVEGRELTAEEAVAAFAAHTKLGQALRTMLEMFNDEVTPASLELLARGALHHNGIDEVSEMVESMRGRMLGNIMGQTFFRIPEPYVVEADSVLGPLRERFGEEWVPEGALYPQVADLMAMSSILTPVVNAARDENRVVSLAEFRKVAAEAAEFTVVGKIAKAEADAIAAELRLGPLPGTFGNLLLRYLPALNSALRATRSPGDVRAALDGFRESIRDLVRQEVRLGALVRGASDAMAEKLAGRFGIEPAEARRRFGYSLHLADRMNKLKDGILYGTYPGCREPGFSAEEEMRNIIDGITEEYVEKLVLVDGLRDVTDETRERLRAIVRQQSRPDKPFVDVRRAQRIAARVDGASLLAALGDPDATDEARFEAIRKYADGISDAAKEEFREERELGSDEMQPVVALVRALVIGANPGLAAALERLSADPFALRVGPHFMQKEHQDHPLRATVASTLL